MKSILIKDKFIDFFVANGHRRIEQISLIPEDATLLFTSAGMVPLKPYFLDLQKPPAPRLVNIQRCLRTTDIEKVGQNGRTLSFFEMLGSWSIGDYFKEKAIRLAWNFLIKELKFSPQQLWATYFAGDKLYPQLEADKESKKFWQEAGMMKNHIVGLGFEDNFWRAGEIGPCGPSTEVYLDRGERYGCGRKDCRPGCDCDRFLEIWNAGVFMSYYCDKKGEYQPLALKSVDTGAGLERLAMVLQKKDSIFETDLFQPIITKICSLLGVVWKENKSIDEKVALTADHIKAAIFLLADGLIPANIEQGYVLRRLIRRAAYSLQSIKEQAPSLAQLVPVVLLVYQDRYPFLKKQEKKIIDEIKKEETRFLSTLHRGRKEVIRAIKEKQAEGTKLLGGEAFYFKETFGIPPEITKTMAVQAGLTVSKAFDEQLKKAKQEHRQQSSQHEKFKGGLADQSETVIKLHTATHILHQALREILGNHVHQGGSNITAQRLRFDFFHPQALTAAEVKKVEAKVNQVIRQNLPVKRKQMTLSAAKKKGALAFFKGRYNEDSVNVYQIGNFSQEVCGGPHVENTAQLGYFEIIKEKSVGSGKRRIYGILK